VNLGFDNLKLARIKMQKELDQRQEKEIEQE